MFAESQVVCIGSLSIHKSCYSLYVIFHYMSVKWHESQMPNIRASQFVFDTNIRLYLPSNFQYKQPHWLQLHWDQCTFSPHTCTRIYTNCILIFYLFFGNFRICVSLYLKLHEYLKLLGTWKINNHFLHRIFSISIRLS